MRRLLALVALPLLGAGCLSSFGASALEADEVQFTQGTTLNIRESSVALPFVGKGLAAYDVVINDVSESGIQIQWESVRERETEASNEARQLALEQMTQGAEVALPPSEIITVVESGVITSDARKIGRALYLPLDWEVGEQNLQGDGTALLFLPTDAYAALVGSGTAEIRLGLIDVLASDAAGMLQTFKDLIGTFSDQPVSGDVVMGADAAMFTVTSLSEQYVLQVDGKRVKVPVLYAESPLAKMVILKNELYPLVLSVDLEPWAAITDVSDIPEFLGRLERGLAPPLGFKVEGVGNRE